MLQIRYERGAINKGKFTSIVEETINAMASYNENEYLQNEVCYKS